MMEPESTTNDNMTSNDESSTANQNCSITEPPTFATNKREALLTCCLCNHKVSKKAKLLPCLHTLCGTCEITGNNQEGKLLCQLCNQWWNASDISEHFLLKYLEVQPEAPKCTNCEDNAAAEFKCIECEEFLCKMCGRAHQRVKLTKDHHLQEVESPNDESLFDDIKCMVHKNEELQWFCITCDKITCRNCQLESHAGHDYCSLEQNVLSQQEEIQSINAETRKKLAEADRVVGLSLKRIAEVKNNTQSLHAAVNKSVEVLKQVLTERADQLCTEIDRVSCEKLNWYDGLNNAMKNYQFVARQIVHFSDLTNEYAKKPDIKQAYDKICKALEYMKQMEAQRKDDVNHLQIQVHSAFYCQQNELIYAIRQYGVLIDRASPANISATSSMTSLTTTSSPAITSSNAMTVSSNTMTSSSTIHQHPSCAPNQIAGSNQARASPSVRASPSIIGPAAFSPQHVDHGNKAQTHILPTPWPTRGVRQHLPAHSTRGQGQGRRRSTCTPNAHQQVQQQLQQHLQQQQQQSMHLKQQQQQQQEQQVLQQQQIQHQHQRNQIMQQQQLAQQPGPQHFLNVVDHAQHVQIPVIPQQHMQMRSALGGAAAASSVAAAAGQWNMPIGHFIRANQNQMLSIAPVFAQQVQQLQQQSVLLHSNRLPQGQNNPQMQHSNVIQSSGQPVAPPNFNLQEQMQSQPAMINLQAFLQNACENPPRSTIGQQPNQLQQIEMPLQQQQLSTQRGPPPPLVRFVSSNAGITTFVNQQQQQQNQDGTQQHYHQQPPLPSGGPTTLKNLVPRPTLYFPPSSSNRNAPTSVARFPPPPPYVDVECNTPSSSALFMVGSAIGEALNKPSPPNKTIIPQSCDNQQQQQQQQQTFRILPLITLDEENVRPEPNSNAESSSAVNELLPKSFNDDNGKRKTSSEQNVSIKTSSAMDSLIAVASETNKTESPHSSNNSIGSDDRQRATPNSTVVDKKAVRTVAPTPTDLNASVSGSSTSGGHTPSRNVNNLTPPRPGARLAKKSIGKTTSYSTAATSSNGGDGGEKRRASSNGSGEDPSSGLAPEKRAKTASPVKKEENSGSIMQQPRPYGTVTTTFPLTEPFDPSTVDDDVMICSPFNLTAAAAAASSPSSVFTMENDSPPRANNNRKQQQEERRTPGANEVTTTTTGREGLNEIEGNPDSRWEDYCSVCQNGGELVCCEAPNCIRVFHIYDHIPQFAEVPPFTIYYGKKMFFRSKFKCGLCTNLDDYKSAEDNIPAEYRRPRKLTAYEQKLCEKVLLELFCHSESLPFHSPVDESFQDYYRVITRPIDFSQIRSRLAQSRYLAVEEFFHDLNQVFINCSIFNEDDSETGKAGLIVGEAYKSLIEKYCPEKLRLVKLKKND